MKESSIEAMSSATGQQLEHYFRRDFSINRRLPENLQILDELSRNFYWSWTAEGTAIFRDLDAQLWEKVEQNPRRMLKDVGEFRLWQKASEPSYVERVRSFAGQSEKYLAAPVNSFGKITEENPVAYFCAEYGIHNSLPIYSGGLGILAGDHLKSASDMNVPLVAVGLFYRFGYFRQKLAHNGWQEERYLDAFKNELALELVTDENGERIFVTIQMRGREVAAQAWLMRVGRISLYLLDTNVPNNAEIDQLITGHLYGGDTETRIVQEEILGIGGVRLLRKLGVEPSVYHLNEGHSAFLTLELAREFLQANAGKNFTDAVKSVREKCVFTTHTPVPAGNDTFAPELLEKCFDAEFLAALKLSTEDFFAFGRVDSDDAHEWFGMTPFAIRMCRSVNGVSEKHGEVSRALWQKMFAGAAAEEVPITFVTNGVHAPTWIAPALKAVYEKHIGADWTEILKHENAWRESVGKIPDEEIWRAHNLLKNQLVAYIRYRIFASETGSLETIHEHSDVKNFFEPEVLTVGFARRVAGYKRWNLLLSDVPRLQRMIGDAERPVQFVFAGKAHPQDRNAKTLLQNLMNQKQNGTWLQRAVFIEDYDQEVARYLVQGVDVWLNVPRRPLEASGTSGQKAAMNGGLNLSILDGWWIEGAGAENGFSVGVLRDEGDLSEEEIDAADAESLYHTLESEVVPAFYETGAGGLPRVWIAKMRSALQTLTPQFSSDRMLKDYLEKIYGTE
jgi:starch phosphorylase